MLSKKMNIKILCWVMAILTFIFGLTALNGIKISAKADMMSDDELQDFMDDACDYIGAGEFVFIDSRLVELESGDEYLSYDELAEKYAVIGYLFEYLPSGFTGELNGDLDDILYSNGLIFIHISGDVFWEVITGLYFEVSANVAWLGSYVYQLDETFGYYIDSRYGMTALGIYLFEQDFYDFLVGVQGPSSDYYIGQPEKIDVFVILRDPLQVGSGLRMYVYDWSTRNFIPYVEDIQ